MVLKEQREVVPHKSEEQWQGSSGGEEGGKVTGWDIKEKGWVW